ncbi:Ethylene-responsive transcription factor ERF114, partial [Dissostichus eleginoides]
GVRFKGCQCAKMGAAVLNESPWRAQVCSECTYLTASPNHVCYGDATHTHTRALKQRPERKRGPRLAPELELMPPDTLKNKAQCFSAATLSIQCQALPASCLKAPLRAGVTHHLVSVSRSHLPQIEATLLRSAEEVQRVAECCWHLARSLLNLADCGK